MSQAEGRAASAKERLREELRRYLVVSAYLYVCFGAIELYKVALLSEAGVRYVPLGFALAKALILGKFLLLGESARVGTRLAAPTLLHRIAWRALLMFALLIALSVVEEVLVGAFHGKSVSQVFADYASHRSLGEMGATSLLVLLVLIPLIVVEDVADALGPGAMRRLLLAPPGGASGPGAQGGDTLR